MNIKEIKREGFLWIDMIDPKYEDLQKIAEQYKLDPTTILDCLEPEHLPKHEQNDGITFIILRAYDLIADKKSDTVQKITNKVALFISQDFLITIHRSEQPYINELFEKTSEKIKEKSVSTFSVSNSIMHSVAKTYEIALETIYKNFDAFEQDVFNKSKKMSLVHSYFLKRRIDIMHRMLSLMKGPILGLLTTAPTHCRLEIKDTKEYLDKVHYQTEVIHANLSSLLALQISLASQITNEASLRTSEVMRVLTVISIFFMPLNFIVGFYGMNFENLPWLHEPMGYVGLTVFLIIVSLGTYFWLKRQNIIKGLK